MSLLPLEYEALLAEAIALQERCAQLEAALARVIAETGRHAAGERMADSAHGGQGLDDPQ
jgi:hypothetical protein